MEALHSERDKWKKESESVVEENAKRMRELMTRESELENEKRDFATRYEEMRKQNNSLQEQVEKVSRGLILEVKAVRAIILENNEMRDLITCCHGF